MASIDSSISSTTPATPTAVEDVAVSILVQGPEKEELSENWLLGSSWECALPEVRELCMKTKELTDAPPLRFARQLPVTVANALVVEWAAPTTNIAVRVLHQLITGLLGDEDDFRRIRSRLFTVNKGLRKVLSLSRSSYSQESLAQRLTSPFFMPAKTFYPTVLTLDEQAKADAARTAAADAAHAAARKEHFHAALCLASLPVSHLPLSRALGRTSADNAPVVNVGGGSSSSRPNDDGTGSSSSSSFSSSSSSSSSSVAPAEGNRSRGARKRLDGDSDGGGSINGRKRGRVSSQSFGSCDGGGNGFDGGGLVPRVAALESAVGSLLSSLDEMHGKVDRLTDLVLTRP